MNDIIKWHYNCTDYFYEKYFKTLLTASMISNNELFIANYKDAEGDEVESNTFYFPFKKDKMNYLIPSKYIDKLPLKIDIPIKISYQGKGYITAEVTRVNDKKIIGLTSMTIKGEKQMEYSELVDTFANIPHSNEQHNRLMKILSLVMYLDRINVRVATSPSFGKNSKMLALKSLTGSVAVISNPTMAKMKFLLSNEAVIIDELAGMKSETKKDIEQFILATGDFRNIFENNSRASSSNQESINISQLSSGYFYNTLDNYKDPKKYFDFMWDNNGAMIDRIIPFKFDGTIDMNALNQQFNKKLVVKENWDFYMRFLRTVQYMKTNYIENPYEIPYFNFEGKARWKRNFDTIAKWTGVFAKDKEQFISDITELYKCHKEYLNMLSNDETVMSTDPQQQLTSLNIYEYMKERKQCSGDELRDQGFEDEDISKACFRGDMYELRADFYEVM